MNNFFKTFFAVILAIFTYSIVSIGFVFIFFAIVVSSVKKESSVKIDENSILRITLEETILDRASDNPLDNFSFSSLSEMKTLGLNDILTSIEKAKTDENIKGIYLELGTVDAGLTMIEEIRNALLDFKETEKFIYCRADYFTQKTYYLATVSDFVYLTPTGNLDFVGFSMQVMFYKKALEKLGIEPQIVRHGKFKSAVEPFMLEEMSDANREQLETYIFSIWDDFISKISDQRKVSSEDLNGYADNLLISTAEKAFEYKLVDGLKYKDEVITELAEKVGVSNSDDLKFVDLATYIKVPEKIDDDFKLVKDKIAVIYAIGSIEMGEGDTYTIGSETLSEAIREACEDESVKAIVLRVNSPGGSALASEIILREVELAQKSKPVVVSMGDYAASGGYYIACTADKIIASPNTLTGSIGVFGLFFNAGELLTEKIGVNVNVVNTNKNSDVGAFYRTMSADEEKYMQFMVEDIYTKFVNHVAEGRNMTATQVDSLGQGRIWSGLNAIELGLVDELGGLDYAIEKAAEIASLEEYRIINLPEIKDPFEQIIEDFSASVRTKILINTIGNEYLYYEHLNQLLESQGIQARMPYSLEIY
jgi:protease-4